MAIKLSAYREGTLYLQLDVPAGGLRLGRGPDNEVILEDPQKRVSRMHAEVKPEGAGYVLIDRESANGTYVQDRRVSRTPLAIGMPFVIGPYRLVLEDSTELDPRAAALDSEQVTGAFHVQSAAVAGDTFRGGPPGALDRAPAGRRWSVWAVVLLAAGLVAAAVAAFVWLR